MPDDTDTYVIFRWKKVKRFPLDVTFRRAEVFENDPTLPENRRWIGHGVDPLRDGWDPGEDPVRVRAPHPRNRIPIR